MGNQSSRHRVQKRRERKSNLHKAHKTSYLVFGKQLNNTLDKLQFHSSVKQNNDQNKVRRWHPGGLTFLSPREMQDDTGKLCQLNEVTPRGSRLTNPKAPPSPSHRPRSPQDTSPSFHCGPLPTQTQQPEPPSTNTRVTSSLRSYQRFCIGAVQHLQKCLAT